MRLAIVIPVVDEEPNLRTTLPEASRMADEVVVADAGSRDGGAAVAAELGVRWVSGTAGRGAQLNLGAASVDADILLFLHADTRLPSEAAERVRGAVADGFVGGGFSVCYDTPSAALRFGTRLINLRTRLTGCPLGDQAQFCTRSAYDEIGGFRDWPILEDLDFIRRLKRHGRTKVLAETVTTSARRFVQQGTIRTVVTNWLIWGLYFAGVSPHRLARWYRHIR